MSIITALKMKFSIEDFFSKCDQIRRFGIQSNASAPWFIKVFDASKSDDVIVSSNSERTVLAQIKSYNN